MSEKKIRISQKKKIALVCSGGGTKAGAFHLGVALALREKGFRFCGGLQTDQNKQTLPSPLEISTYVGSSAGSVIATYLAAGYSLDNIFHSYLREEPSPLSDLSPKPLPPLIYKKMFKLRKEFAKENLGWLKDYRKILTGAIRGDLSSILQFKWLKAIGLFSTAGIEKYIREDVLFSNRFEDYKADLFIVATQLDHSRKVVFGKYHYQPPPDDLTCEYNNHSAISKACAASTALPFIFAPYPIKDKNGEKNYYIDGEVRDTLSTHVAADAGADLIIASYTHQPYHLTPTIESLTEHGISPILIQSIYLLIEQKINAHIYHKESCKKAMDAVSKYCHAQGISQQHKSRILEILESELGTRREVDTIYIHPKPDDSDMFFMEHFSLSQQKMIQISRSGFQAAIEVLKKYEFENEESPHATRSAL